MNLVMRVADKYSVQILGNFANNFQSAGICRVLSFIGLERAVQKRVIRATVIGQFDFLMNLQHDFLLSIDLIKGWQKPIWRRQVIPEFVEIPLR